MATRRRGADLSDLKSRLGLPEAPAEPESAPEPDPSEAGDDAEGAAAAPSPAGATAGAPAAAAPARPARAPAPQKAAPAAAPLADDDYASAVSSAESSEPISSGPEEPLDDSAMRSSLPLGLVIAVVASAGIALALGYLAGSVFDGRRVVNAQIAEATNIQQDVERVAAQINQARNSVDGIDLGAYRPEFDDALRSVWESNPPVLQPRVLTVARTLMAYNEDLSRALLDYAIESQLLNDLVQQHLRLSARDSNDIARELAGAEDTRNFGLVFDFRGQATAYQGFIDDPEGAPFVPMRATRVTYEDLEVITQGENDFFNVNFLDGQDRNVPVVNLVLMPRDQLLTEATTDTPVTRWRQRANRIQERVIGLAENQARVRQLIAEVADRDTLFTL